MFTTEENESLLLTNAVIFSGDNAHTLNGFIAIESGRILAVGARHQTPPLQKFSRVIDMQGAFVMPGIVESHGHLFSYGEIFTQVDLTPIPTLAAAITAIKAHTATLAKDAWVLGWGWDENRWGLPHTPTRSQLDRIVSDRPVSLQRIDGHATWVNSKALELAGITDDTPNPSGGLIERDQTGKASGILVDKAMDLVLKIIPPQTESERKAAITDAASECIRLGITSFHDAWTSRAELALYESLALENRLALRMYLMLDGRDPELLRTYFERGPLIAGPDEKLTIRAVKLFADGALGSRGGWLMEPYSDDPENFGLTLSNADHIASICIQALKAGYQVGTHAIGDRANKEVLDGYEMAFKSVPFGREARFRIEHAQHIHPSDLKRFDELGLIAAVQPTHCTSDWEWALKRLGTKRCIETSYLWQSLWQSGAVVCAGSDVPIESPHPLLGLYAAVTRRSPQTEQSLTAMTNTECLTRLQALQAMTINGAFAAWQERWLGRLAPGYSADISAWSHNLLRCSDSEILQAKNLMTLTSGRQAFYNL